MTLAPTTSDALILHFRIPHNLEHFPPGLRFSVRYRSEFDSRGGDSDGGNNGTWTRLDTSDEDPHRKEFELPLVGLHPYAEYTAEVRLVSAKADYADERLWSAASFAAARTLPRRPDAPPRVATGSFEVVGGSLEERRVYLYWQRIPPTMHNGPGFGYIVTDVSEAGKDR